MPAQTHKEVLHDSGEPHRATDGRERRVPTSPNGAPGIRTRAGDTTRNRAALGGPTVADERAEEAEADGQGPDGVDHPARAPGRQRLTRRRLTRPRKAAGDDGFRGLSHLSPRGDARMVDVSAKADTAREAVARALIRMKPATLRAVRRGDA